MTTGSDEGGGNEETNLLRENPQVSKPRGLIYQTVSKGSRCETFFRAGLCHPRTHERMVAHCASWCLNDQFYVEARRKLKSHWMYLAKIANRVEEQRVYSLPQLSANGHKGGHRPSSRGWMMRDNRQSHMHCIHSEGNTWLPELRRKPTCSRT